MGGENMSRKEDNAFAEAVTAMSYLLRHRGPIRIPALPGIKPRTIDTIKLGTKTIYLNNTIPALIEDTFANLGYEQKDGTKPVIAAKRKTEYGWHLVINLPPGVSFKQLKNDKDYFQDATNAWIELEWKAGKCHMNIQVGELPTYIEYQWDPELYANMKLPIPIGYSRTQPIVLDLPESPHLLIGGSTGYGKTSLIMAIIQAVIGKTYVVIIDLKGIDFGYLENHCLLAQSNEEATLVLAALNNEFEKRKLILRRYKVRKWSDCPEPIPYIVVIIDEIAELSKDNIILMDRLVRLARATGISIIAASQRTSTQVIPGDTRSNFVARICFKVASAADCRVIMGEDCGLAGEMMPIKGRAIYRFGIDLLEVQSMFLNPDKAEELILLSPKRRWNIEPEPKPVQEAKTKRLRAR
jgi:S-DNA-T family DNA segregation ATPase FtsK/SpoIIIE